MQLNSCFIRVEMCISMLFQHDVFTRVFYAKMVKELIGFLLHSENQIELVVSN